ALGVAATMTSAADTKYSLTGDNTKLTFTGTKAKGKHDGGFKKLTGTATVTDGDPGTLKIEADIDVDSIYTDDTKLTGHLKGPDFFGVKDNPTATFKTTKVEKGDKGYTITGDLTMLGKTKPVTMLATISVAGDTITITSDFKIDRTNWGMTYGKGQIDNDVALKLSVKAKK
ncbi:MAG TPA: YceI family protein, partial [Gemmata sp.]|nr:YceI family protein [Gemmata sp.]